MSDPAPADNVVHIHRGDDAGSTAGPYDPGDVNADFDPSQLWDNLPNRVSDRINGLKLADVLRERVIYVPGEGRLVYVDGAWYRDESGQTESWVGEWLDGAAVEAQTTDNEELRQRVARLESWAGLQAALQYVDIELATRVHDLNQNPYLLVTPTGTLDLRTAQLREHRADDLTTDCTSVPYSPEARSELLTQFLDTFLPDPAHRRYIFKLMGSALLGGNRFRHLILIHGETSSGKSTFADLVAAALGKGYMKAVNVSVFRGSFDDKPRPDLMAALASRIVYASEAATSWELHADMVKRMTGGDQLVVRGMHSDRMVERPAMFTPVIVTNEIPRIKKADAAVRRRLRVLPFDRTISETDEDIGFRERLINDPAARQAMLAQLVLGCRAALLEGLTDLPAEFTLRADLAFDKLSHLADFLRWARTEGVLIEPDEDEARQIPTSKFVKASDLYRLYVAWVEEFGDQSDRHERLSLRAFCDTLRNVEKGSWRTQASGGARFVGKLLRALGAPS
jgi:P4 family phage/plasmid primase-like protien